MTESQKRGLQNHKATDFSRLPNELCQDTIKENFDSLNQTTIEQQSKMKLEQAQHKNIKHAYMHRE